MHAACIARRPEVVLEVLLLYARTKIAGGCSSSDLTDKLERLQSKMQNKCLVRLFAYSRTRLETSLISLARFHQWDGMQRVDFAPTSVHLGTQSRDAPGCSLTHPSSSSHSFDDARILLSLPSHTTVPELSFSSPLPPPPSYALYLPTTEQAQPETRSIVKGLFFRRGSASSTLSSSASSMVEERDAPPEYYV